MKLLSNIIDKSKLEQYLSSEIDIFIVGNKDYTSRHGADFNFAEIKELKEKIGEDKKVYVLMNQLYDEVKLNDIKEYLKKLNLCHIDGLIFQDFSILQYKKDFDLTFDLIYDSMTLNTNGYTLEYLQTLGISSFFLSREISLVDIEEILDMLHGNAIVQLDGLRYVAQSKRKLLTNYFKEKQIQKDPTLKYRIQPENTNVINFIMEDTFGSHIISEQRLLSYGILDKLLDKELKYGYINAFLFDFEEQMKIVDSYKKAITLYNTKDYAPYMESLQEEVGDSGFYDEATVYRLEDVRKRDADERN